MEHDIYLIAAGAIAGFAGTAIVKKLKAKSLDVEPAQPKAEQLRVVERKQEPQRRANRNSNYNRSPKLIDETKRKNLQPGNIKTIKEVINKSVHDVQNFEHKFFGTVLEVEGRVLIDSLPKKLHSFEVLDGVCYIDGSVVKIHPDEILKLARSIE
jgi:hypothetical protein